MNSIRNKLKHPHGSRLGRHLAASLTLALPAMAAEPAPAAIPKPSPEQVAWQERAMGMFYHFDIITFTDMDEGAWQGAGHLDPNLYNPAKLSTDQWMEAAKAMGARYSVFVAKHCTGFISWQSDAYPYGVRQSKWRDGKGDVVRDYVTSSSKFGIRPGLYCSMPANAYCDVFEKCLVKDAKGPDDPRLVEYRRRAQKMVTELWGNYGPLTYIWFDGGVLPVAKGGADLAPIQRRLQPQAVTFGGPAENPAGLSRWPGNENGITSYPNWSTVLHDNEEGAGHAEGLVWEPGECDVPLRKQQWFWHRNQENTLRSLDELMDIYYKSVGRNANLIVNASIDRDGLVPAPDMQRFKEFGDEIRRRFGQPLALTSGEGETVDLALAKPATINHAIIMEKLAEGERIREYTLEGFTGGAWKELCKGQSIGHKRIEQFPDVEVAKIRLHVTKCIAKPLIRQLSIYHVTPRPQ